MKHRQYRYTIEDVARDSGLTVRAVRRLVAMGRLDLGSYVKAASFVIGRRLEQEAAMETTGGSK